MTSRSLRICAGIAVVIVATHETRAQSFQAVSQEVRSNYERFRSIPNLRVRFTLRHEQLAGERSFAFDHAEVDTYRKVKMLYLDLSGTLFYGRTIRRTYAWDGKVGTAIETRRGDAGEYLVSASPQNNLCYYNFYIDYLCYPDASGSAQSPSRKGAPSAGGWLPAVLGDDQGRWDVRMERETGEGADCLVLDRARRDAYWFDPKNGYALRRHERFDPETGNRIHTTVYREFKYVEGVYLPQLIVRDEYPQKTGAAGHESRPVSRKTIAVEQFSVDEVPDSLFRIPAPDGIKVHDSIHNAAYTFTKKSTDRIVASGEAARNQISLPPSEWLMGLAAVLLVFGIVFTWRLHTRHDHKRGA